MKFPLATAPFAPIALSQSECLAFRATAMALVDDCIKEQQHHHHHVDPRVWKQVNSMENVAVYCSKTPPSNNQSSTSTQQLHQQLRKTGSVASLRSSSSPRSASSPTPSPSTSSHSSSDAAPPPTHDWKLPRLMGVGKIVGTVDDLLYGLVAPDRETMQITASYLSEGQHAPPPPLDSHLLCGLQCPSESKPFRTLSIKWAVQKQSSKLRDLVFLEATGTKTLPSGEKLGYFVQHSVELPEVGELRNSGISGAARSHLSWVAVFKEGASIGCVELYMTLWSDPGLDSSLSSQKAIHQASALMLTMWQVPHCAQNKKLAWLMRESSGTRSSTRSLAQAKADKTKCCSLCLRSVGGFSTLTMCELCLCKVCSRCVTTRTLVYLQPNGAPVKVPSGFCKNCTTRASRTSGRELSILEHVPGAAAAAAVASRDDEPGIAMQLAVEAATPKASSAPRRRELSAVRSFVATPSATPTARSMAGGRSIGGGWEPSQPATPLAGTHQRGYGGQVGQVGLGGLGDLGDLAGGGGYNGSTAAGTGPATADGSSDLIPLVAVERRQQRRDQYELLAPPKPLMMTTALSTPMAVADEHQHRRKLWLQMNQLRAQADHVYWQTKQNSVAHHHAIADHP